MLIIHGANASPFVRKVRVALAEKGIAYELNPVIPFGQSEEYRRKSPLGKIPCLEDGDYVLPDSSCIIAYLERVRPKPPLYPEDAREFGRALWYEEYCDTKLVETLGPVFFERWVKPNFMKQQPDEALVRKKLDQEAPPVFDYLDSEIGDGNALAGGRFSIADIALASPFVNLAHAGEGIDAKRWKNLARHVASVQARPAFKSLIEEEMAQMGSASR